METDVKIIMLGLDAGDAPVNPQEAMMTAEYMAGLQRAGYKIGLNVIIGIPESRHEAFSPQVKSLQHVTLIRRTEEAVNVSIT